MYRAHSLSVGLIVMLVLSLFVAFAVLLTPTQAFWGYGGCCGCQETWCAWSATWHAPSALDTPLRPYYMPRTPGCCSREYYANFAVGCGCEVADAGCAPGGAGCGWGYPPQAGVGFEPVQFERLGQVPNDMGLGGLPAEGPQGR